MNEQGHGTEASSDRSNATGIRQALVTGASGYIGGVLARRLAEQGIRVRALCRDPRKAAFLQGVPNIEIAQGDVQDAERLHAQATGCDAVFHIAATFTTPAAVHYRINVQGSLNVAEAAHTAGARLVHMSTVGIYGLGVRGAVTEDHPQYPSPREFYQQSKQIGEARVWDFARRTGLPTSVIRPAMVYGPGSGFWSGTLYQLCRSLPAVPQFAGDAHPIYIDDVVDLTIRLATHPVAVGEAFHCAPDPAVPWTTYLNMLAEIAGRSRRLSVPVQALSPVALPFDLYAMIKGTPQDISAMMRFIGNHAVYKMDKARDRLGWTPRVTLDEGMRATAPWLLGEYHTGS